MNYYFLRFPEGKTKAVTFSYDDGCRADLKLAETLNKYGLKCTFNINSEGRSEDKRHLRLTNTEIAQYLLGTGHEIAVHGALHKAPGSVSLVDGIRDVLECRIALERAFGGIIKGMAYPNSGIRIFDNNASYSDVRSYIEQLGISYARTLGEDNNKFLMPEDWYSWVPTAHHDNPNLFNWMDEFLNLDINSLYAGAKRPKLFYIWGHAYEFEKNNNWNRLEKICEKISGKDDIWYATNIDIYNYTKAYHSMEFNVDRTIAYNPTLYTVWFHADGKDYCIKSGETIKF